MDENIRYEINHQGKMVVGQTSLSNNLSLLIKQLFSQYGWNYHEVEQHSAYRKVIITSPLGEKYTVNLFAGNIRNEKRSPYEKKIQLNREDPRQYKGEITIILGFYVFCENDPLEEAIIVGYPVDETINYDSNPSLRGVFVNDILLKAKNNGVCIDKERRLVGFRPEFIFYYLMNYSNFHNYSDSNYSSSEMQSFYAGDGNNYLNNSIATNKVYYGTPGCGKSYKVMQEWFNYVNGKWIDKPGKLSERTTFYPDYTNSDFVGQVMPGLDDNGQPTYEFVEGPFTKALIAAFNNPDKDVALIIEELNRGNAAAIFGEIFQLLDRDETGKSQYSIYNPNIIKELNKEVSTDKKPDGHDFINVYIPSNMSIIATMNTSDQNVYPLDTAFQRRWKFEKIKNSFLKDGVEETAENLDNQENYVSEQAYKLAKMFIPGTATTWREFVKVLNEKIVEDHDASFSSEDKQIGVYFLSKEELCVEKFTNVNDAAKLFSEKMLKYIWEDVAKLNPDDWFDSCKSLDEVFSSFSVNHLNVFKNMTFETYSEEE